MIKVIELFAGIGAQAQALQNAGIDFKTVAISEIDKYAVQSYELLHGEVNNLGDISKIQIENVPDCDLLTFSFPCQDISIMGKKRGLEPESGTRSSLLWECERIIKAKKPKYLLMENVKNLVSPTYIKWFNIWLDKLSDLGYNNYWEVLNAVDYNTPQSRERIFCVSILKENDTGFIFPKKQERKLALKDILEDEKNIPSNLYMNDKPYTPRDEELCSPSSNGLIWIGNLNTIHNDMVKRVYSIEGVCPTLTTMTGGYRQPKIYIDGKGVRRLSARECWAVMGFGTTEFDKVKDYISKTQLYHQAGNSIAVPCLQAIFEELFKEK